jgi:hypothetical protein
MTDTERTSTEELAADMLRINIEASIRCGKAREPRLLAYHASTCAASWAAFRLIDALRQHAPDTADTFVTELIAELNDGDYLEDADEYATALGVDVGALAESVRAEFETPAVPSTPEA